MKFTKMHGCGNDYVYVDGFKEHVEDRSAFAIKVSDRRFGIGGDGAIFILPSEVADVMMDMYNNDGSQGKMCGNGVRCVAKYAYDHGLIPADRREIAVETLSGIKYIALNVEDGKVVSARVDMGPVTYDHAKLSALDREFDMTLVDIGNPHAISYVDDVKDYPVEKYGKVLEFDKAFPNRSNIEFVKVKDRGHIDMRVWERGSGETWACGTGACASAYACYVNGLTDDEVEVSMLGGKLVIKYDSETGHVFMTGPAVEVFTGEFDERR